MDDNFPDNVETAEVPASGKQPAKRNRGQITSANAKHYDILRGMEFTENKPVEQAMFKSQAPGEYIVYTETRPGHFVANILTSEAGG